MKNNNTEVINLRLNNFKDFFYNKKTQKKLGIFIFIFLIIQPLFDLKFFYNSISTLIRVIIIGVLFLFYFFTSSNKKKYWLLLYLLSITTYFIFHHINATHFNSLVPGNFNYSIISELLYLIKMITPFLLIYILYKLKISPKKVLKIIDYQILIIGSIIIVSNIFMFSYGSYSDEIIKANFFSWFSPSSFTYQELCSKGLFEYANQISAILIMFLPFSLSNFLKEKNFKMVFILIINISALFLLGTKVSVLGVILVFIYTITVYLFYNKFKLKQSITAKPIIVVCLMFVCYLILLPKNPIFLRIDESKSIAASSTPETLSEEPIIQNTTVDSSNSNCISENSLDYIFDNYKDKEIKDEFILQSYPYKYDPEFWLTIFEQPRYNRVNYRFMEESMIKRVVAINNNKYDIWLGITNTRLQNIFNIERDLIVQYYALGIIGLILVFSPYLVLITLYLYKLSKSKLNNLTLENFLAFISIVLVFGMSYFSGNLLNSLSFTLYFALLYSLLLKDSCIS